MITKSFKKDILFLHLSNFKSYENIYFRCKMNPYFSQSEFNNYYEYMLNQENSKKYTYFDIINFKIEQLNKRHNWIYEKHDDWDRQWDMFESLPVLEKFDIKYDISKIDKELFNYINKNFKHIEINSNPLKFKFICNETDSLTNLYYWYNENPNCIGNFGDLLSGYLFEKLTGYKHNHINIQKNNEEFHYMTGSSIINYANNKSIIWGSGIIQQNLNKIEPLEITCVRGQEPV